MSAAWVLVKFKKTGNIYYGCYEGTSDTIRPFLCTPQECYDPEIDCYCPISYCRDLSRQHSSWRFPDNVDDLDDVEIYSDYGGCFYWDGTGSESIKMINPVLDEYGELMLPNEKSGMPKWVKEHFKSRENKEEQNNENV